jgi:hypothetical protein
MSFWQNEAIDAEQKGIGVQCDLKPESQRPGYPNQPETDSKMRSKRDRLCAFKRASFGSKDEQASHGRQHRHQKQPRNAFNPDPEHAPAINLTSPKPSPSYPRIQRYAARNRDTPANELGIPSPTAPLSL